MKLSKKTTKCTSFLLILSIFLALLTVTILGLINKEIVHADTIETEPNNVEVEKENLDEFYSSIDTFETELEMYNTSVLAELNNQLNRYKKMLENKTYKDFDNVNKLIATTENLITEYEIYENRNKSRASYHAVYTPMIAAAIAYFNANSYILSAEMLTHAKDNKTLHSIYKPEHTNVIASGKYFREIAYGYSTSGDSKFERTGKTIDDDLYLAFRYFYYSKTLYNSKTVTIIDTYDFAEEKEPTNVEEFAIQKMYEAQQAGALIPFKINVAVSDIGMPTINQTDYYYDESVGLYKTEVRNIVLSVYDYSNMNIEVLGSAQNLLLVVDCLQWDKKKSVISKNINFDVQFTSSDIVPTLVTITLANTLVTKSSSVTLQITCS